MRREVLRRKEYRCEVCGIDKWNNKALTLEIHHKDGDSKNNNMDNLEVLCPNCHSQTLNYRRSTKARKTADKEIINSIKTSKSIRQAAEKLGYTNSVGGNYVRFKRIMSENDVHLIKQKKNKCQMCGKIIDSRATYCNGCRKIYNDSRIPSMDILKLKIRETSFVQVGKDFGVTDNAVRKWCKKYSPPYKTSDVKNISDEEWKRL